MSDEVAFLNALKANPADDTARLVYADWLDEHNEPLKSEYLRLVSALATRNTDFSDSPEMRRVLEIASGLNQTWRSASGSRFALILTEFTDKVKSIKATRELMDTGLGESKAFVESVPVRFPLRLTPDAAVGVKRHFSGGQINIDAVCRANDPAVPIVFDVSAHLVPTRWELGHTSLPPDSLQAFRDFLVASGHMTRAKAVKLRRAESTTLATDLESHQLEKRLSEWHALLPSADAERTWHIRFQIVFHPQRQK